MTGKDRPRGMSLLDYLWTTYGDYYVSTSASDVSSDEVILTENAIVNLIGEAGSKGIVDLIYRDNPEDLSLSLLVGVDSEGNELTVVNIPKADNILLFLETTVTLEDINNGCPFNIDTNVLKLELSSGTTFYIDLNKLVASNISISTEDTGIILNNNDGLSAYIPLGSSDQIVRFEQLSLSDYESLTDKRLGTIYFITDYPYIYLNGNKYGTNLDSDLTAIVSITYNPTDCTITYKKADETTNTINLEFVSETNGGLLSSEDYVAFKEALEWKNINL